MDALVHRRLLLARSFHIQEFHQRLYGNALQKHGEIDDGNGRRYEHRLRLHALLFYQQSEGKRNGSTEACGRGKPICLSIESEFIKRERLAYLHTTSQTGPLSRACAA